jgi:hypothetical protein
VLLVMDFGLVFGGLQMRDDLGGVPSMSKACRRRGKFISPQSHRDTEEISAFSVTLCLCGGFSYFAESAFSRALKRDL